VADRALSLPALTAIATLIAAAIGGTVAVLVAVINTRAARQVAIDTAHRAYRTTLAQASIDAAVAFLGQLYHLAEAQAIGDAAGMQAAIGALTARRPRLDFREPHDEDFAEAVRLFRRRRTHAREWLRAATLDADGVNAVDAAALFVLQAHVNEAARIVQIAAEAYIFDVEKQRKLARGMQKKATFSPWRDLDRAIATLRRDLAAWSETPEAAERMGDHEGFFHQFDE
jgi:hypothetical protein